MKYDLPTAVEVNGTEHQIRSDYRDILTIIEALSDAELSEEEKAEAMLDIFYPDFAEMPQSDYEEAIKQCAKFINCGEEQREEKRGPKLMDWQQDFPLIVAPVNRVLGQEVRSVEYLHWWTWVSAYQEIGDCTFAQVVGIRNKKAKGKKIKANRSFTSRTGTWLTSSGSIRNRTRTLSANGYENRPPERAAGALNVFHSFCDFFRLLTHGIGFVLLHSRNYGVSENAR